MSEDQVYGNYTLKRKDDKEKEFQRKANEVKQWVEEVLQTKFNSEDFGENFKDGVALCQLMMKIKPGLKEPQPTRIQFKMLDNVQYFISSCREYGVTNIFLPAELVNQTNLMKVITCIQELSQLAEINGFAPVMKGSTRITSSPSSLEVRRSARRTSILRKKVSTGGSESESEREDMEEENERQRLAQIRITLEKDRLREENEKLKLENERLRLEKEENDKEKKEKKKIKEEQRRKEEEERVKQQREVDEERTRKLEEEFRLQEEQRLKEQTRRKEEE